MAATHRHLAVTLADRFWCKVNRGAAGECWPWLAAMDRRDGYGRFGIGARTVGAHRVAYELTVGPIPRGLVIDHLCRNRACCNPSHMEPVTIGENVRRGGRHGRSEVSS